MKATKRHTLLWSGANWTEPLIRAAYDEIATIALGEFGLNVYPNQIEIITSEQMLDRYASNGMPFMYRHWSFGKHFAHHERLYRKGITGLAYEIVINTNPCIVHLMEENSMTMQALVIAHAAFGHNHFFKSNHLFKQWTDAGGILGYLAFARDYIHKCEDEQGMQKVEQVLDSAHALQNLGIDRASRPRKPNLIDEKKRQQARMEEASRSYNDLWEKTLPNRKSSVVEEERDRRRRRLNLPEENILYFIEKNAPRMEPWQREIVRIVRNISQYFYPQQQTKVMNEGCATFVHYQTMRRLHEKGLITDGSMLEFLQSHTNVVFQPRFNEPGFGGINPYALGFAMMRDIQRIATEPTDEDRRWFPDFAGKGDPWSVLRHAWGEFRDESFIQQFLSPKVIRDFKLFSIYDSAENSELLVDAIHDERGYRKVRRLLAGQYDVAQNDPDIRIEDVDLSGDRTLTLHHVVNNGVRLDQGSVEKTLKHLVSLWGYGVHLLEVDKDGTVRAEHNAR
ncbi:MAG: SpoVR family protein [Parcubacteria group bacterium]|nr:SpoVR family protein [Parcubacteria group bacterium]